MFTGNMVNKGVLYVPEESVEDYKAAQADGWNCYDIRAIYWNADLELSQTETDLAMGEQQAITVSLAPHLAELPVEWIVENNNGTIEFTVSDDNTHIASIKGLKPGTVKITAKLKEQPGVVTKELPEASCAITVIEPTLTAMAFDFSDIEDYDDALTLQAGSTHKLKLIPSPEYASIPSDITWTSSNESVATVTDGVVTAIAAGDAVIGASVVVAGTTISTSCNLAVVPIPSSSGVTALTLGMAIKVGESADIYAFCTPDNLSPEIEWSVDAAEIIKITTATDNTAKATIAGLKQGTVSVTGRVKDDAGSPEVKCIITVVNANPTEENPEEGENPENPEKPETPEVPEDPDDTTNISSATNDGGFIGSVDIYNISGQLVKQQVEESTVWTLTPGVYIIHQGTLSRKILVK